MLNSDKRLRQICITSVTIFLLLALAYAWRRGPWNDEGWFASASVNLATRGFMGTTVIEPTGTHLAVPLIGIQQYTYWVLPVYLVFQALWYKIWGFSFFAMRASSILFGLAGLVAFRVAAEKLTGSRRAAWVATSILALDTLYMNVSTLGRMDMMATALGWVALALYLTLRSSRYTWAVVAGYSTLALACFTHHQSALAGIALLTTTLYLDRTRIRFIHIVLAGLPFLVLGGLWGLYAAQHSDYFFAQLQSNGSGRMSTVTHPMLALQREIVRRYGVTYGFEAGSHPARKLLLLVPICYFSSIAIGLISSTIRAQMNFVFLCVLLGLQITFQFFFEGMKLSLYLIHLTGWYTLILAVVLVAVWEQRMAIRKPALAVVSAMVAVQVMASLMVIAKNDYHNRFAPLKAVLADYNRDGSLIVGSPELGLEIGFDHLIDDLRIGYYSHQHPAAVVLDGRYRDWMGRFQSAEPQVLLHIDSLLSRYQKVYDDAGYTVYADPARAIGSAAR